MATAQSLAKRVRAAREARGWTNQRLAQEAHVAPGTITRIEHGEPTRAGNLGAVLEALGIDPDAASDYPPDIDAAMAYVAEWLLPMSPDQRFAATVKLAQLVSGNTGDPLAGATARERRAIEEARSAERRA